MWTPQKAKLPLLPFNRHPNQEQSKGNCTKYKSLISPQSRASYSQSPKKIEQGEDRNLPQDYRKWQSSAFLRFDLLLLVHRVYCRTKINVATTVDFFSRTRRKVNLLQRRDTPTAKPKAQWRQDCNQDMSAADPAHPCPLRKYILKRQIRTGSLTNSKRFWRMHVLLHTHTTTRNTVLLLLMPSCKNIP